MPRLLHTADWHLGKRLHDFRLLSEQREALQRLLDVIDAGAPELVVVAGDVFDVPVPPLSALESWAWVVEEIVGLRGVPLIAIPGNHDQAERLAMNAGLTERAGLYVRHDLAGAHEPLRVAGVDVFAVPFHKPPRVRALASGAGADAAAFAVGGSQEIGDFDYDAAMAWLLARARAQRDPTVPSVLLAHAFVAGAGEEGEGEEPLMVGGAGAVAGGTLSGFDYVALGHLHAPRALPNLPTVRYSGSLYPYAFGETGAKSATLVHLPDASGGAVEVESAALEVERRVRVVEGVTFERAIRDGAALREAGDPRVDDYLLVRVSDRDPIDHAQSRLREVYPNSLLEQPVVEVRPGARSLAVDARTMSVEDAFLAFYQEVFDEPPGELERELLSEALAAGDEEGLVSGS